MRSLGAGTNPAGAGEPPHSPPSPAQRCCWLPSQCVEPRADAWPEQLVRDHPEQFCYADGAPHKTSAFNYLKQCW